MTGEELLIKGRQIKYFGLLGLWAVLRASAVQFFGG